MKKLNNKGFSLVELIIVIAIMAILVGVVGTQVIPYLENSRKAKDTQVLSAWNTAAVSAYSTEAGNLNSMTLYKITIEGGSDIAINDTAFASMTKDDEKALYKTFTSLAGIPSDFDFEEDMASKAGKHITCVTITISGEDGTVITTVACDGDYEFDPIENK